MMNSILYFDEVLQTYPPQTSPKFEPTTTLHTLRISGRYNRRMLSELCSIFKIDRYLKLAGAKIRRYMCSLWQHHTNTRTCNRVMCSLNTQATIHSCGASAGGVTLRL
jgi:hypothetical protein